MSAFLRRFIIRRVGVMRLLTDGILLLASLYLSLWLRTDPASFQVHVGPLSRWALIFVAIRMLCFLSFGVYQALWRYISVPDVIHLAQAIVFSIPLLISTTYIFPKIGYLPRSLFFIDGFVSLALLTAFRLSRRRSYELIQKREDSPAIDRILIYGAGLKGRMLAQHFLNNPERSVKILGFIDDDPAKQHMVIGGIPVLGSGEDLETIFKRAEPSDVVLTMKDRPQTLLRDLILTSRKHRVRAQVLSEFRSQGFSLGRVSPYREVDLTDLLRRPPTKIDVTAVQSMLEGRVVLVTGAGGSIGSELSRQIARLHPAKLLLLDHSEFNLYEIDRELRPTSDIERIVPLLIDVRDREGLSHVFRTAKPNVVFHAAAYKHVHLVEANAISSILSNVLGTKNVLDLCEEHGVERFGLISTDKAVNPAGIMGATKRVCELLTGEKAYKVNRAFSSVRFGNVLGSSGSVVPLMKSQIEAGGPVTVTHPDMTRYFMLIPEAVSLVLMASYLAQPADIAVLSMGEPIRIVDLAKSLMALMGKAEDEIPIVFTGVRPGEKLSEELYLAGDELRTPHPDILMVPRGDMGATLTKGSQGPQFARQMERLISLAQAYDERCLDELESLVRSGDFVAPVESRGTLVKSAK